MSKSLAQLSISGETYSIRASDHALQRMAERGVDEYVVAGTVVSLGKARLQELQDEDAEAIIIDEAKDVAVVIGFRGNRVMVITVINKSNVFVKSDTTIERLDCTNRRPTSL